MTEHYQDGTRWRQFWEMMVDILAVGVGIVAVQLTIVLIMTAIFRNLDFWWWW